MKLTHKIIMTILLSLGVTAAAARAITSETTNFNTIEEAMENCPAIDSMIFFAFNSTPGSEGTITGNDPYGRRFRNTGASVPRPKRIDATGHIKDVKFSLKNGRYGFVSCAWGMCIYACYYSYPDLDGMKKELTMGNY